MLGGLWPNSTLPPESGAQPRDDPIPATEIVERKPRRETTEETDSSMGGRAHSSGPGLGEVCHGREYSGSTSAAQSACGQRCRSVVRDQRREFRPRPRRNPIRSESRRLARNSLSGVELTVSVAGRFAQSRRLESISNLCNSPAVQVGSGAPIRTGSRCGRDPEVAENESQERIPAVLRSAMGGGLPTAISTSRTEYAALH